MSKKDKILIIWMSIFVPFILLCGAAGGITACFNKQVGLILLGIGVGVMLLFLMIPYITWCVIQTIKLMKDED